jgi:hypothetical protein
MVHSREPNGQKAPLVDAPFATAPRSIAIEAIQSLPKHCLQGAGYILRPGLVGSFGNPVPSLAGIQLLR